MRRGMLAAGFGGGMRRWWILGTCGALGCQEYTISRLEREDFFAQEPAAEVDILLVVDNSCSMQPYQDRLSQNFETFLTYFEQGDVDYRIGVTTTTATPQEFVQGFTCPQAQMDRIPAPGRLVGDTYITPETPDGAALFSDLVNVGVCGSGTEMGLEAANLALSELEDVFLRSEASVSIIFVSDEEDQSPWPVNDYINAFRDVKGARSFDSFNASALVVTETEECSAPQLAAGGGTAGTRYVEMAEQNGGILGNICEDSFDAVVTELSLASSRLRDTFWLAERPDLSTLTVLIDGEEVACDVGGWTYQQLDHEEEVAAPAIVFDRSRMPPPQTEILVRYNAGEGGEFACGGEA